MVSSSFGLRTHMVIIRRFWVLGYFLVFCCIFFLVGYCKDVFCCCILQEQFSDPLQVQSNLTEITTICLFWLYCNMFQVVEEACTNLLPNVVCEYLYNLSEMFTKFYTNCQVYFFPFASRFSLEMNLTLILGYLLLRLASAHTNCKKDPFISIQR